MPTHYSLRSSLLGTPYEKAILTRRIACRSSRSLMLQHCGPLGEELAGMVAAVQRKDSHHTCSHERVRASDHGVREALRRVGSRI